MAARATVRRNEGKQRWMARVRFPDGSRRKAERVEKVDAEADLNELLALRAAGGEPLPRRGRLATFNEVLDEWLSPGCPSAVAGTRTRHARQKSDATIDNARRLLAIHVRPAVGSLWVDRTRTARVEEVFAAMDETGLMCGLRSDELAGLRWPLVDIDSDEPSIEVAERAREVSQKNVDQATPKDKRSRRNIGWTTYELRHSFVSLVADHLDDLVKVADLAGHTDPRTTQGYRHRVRPSLPHAIEAWDALLSRQSTAP